MSNLQFMMKTPEWVKDIKDKDVFSVVYALIFSHQVDNKPFTEDGLKKEIDDFNDLTEEQKQEVFDLIISHKA